MDLFGDEYIDNNLVFCSSNGRPMESQVINRAFNKLIKENGLPHVVFHSLRHSSITYKLKLNGGDMKSVQGAFLRPVRRSPPVNRPYEGRTNIVG